MPYGRDLCGEGLKKDLNRVFEKHAENADAPSPKRSTYVNESLNLVVESRPPKMHHYSKSECLDFRTGSPYCQKSIAQAYMTDVNTAIGSSLAKSAISFPHSRKSSNLKKKEKSSAIQLKKRRLQLKENRRSSSSQQQFREGVTYESFVYL